MENIKSRKTYLDQIREGGKMVSEGGQLRILSSGELYEIHLATLEILECIGVKVLRMLGEAGAHIDIKEKIAKIPRHLVEEAENLPWTKIELVDYLDECTPYQKALSSALVQTDVEPVPKKKLLYLMNQVAEKSPKIEIEKKITGYGIAGARAGLKMRRNPLKKEDIIDSKWNDEVGDYVYRIKPQYKNNVTEWVRKQGFLA
jgi:hypothetical protein